MSLQNPQPLSGPQEHWQLAQMGLQRGPDSRMPVLLAANARCLSCQPGHLADDVTCYEEPRPAI